MPPRWAAMLVAAAALCTWEGRVVATSHDTCSPFKSGSAFADRVDELSSCLEHLGPNLVDAIVSHELDYDRKLPLSMVLFSNSSETLQSSSNVLAATYFGYGSAASDRLVHLDIHEMIQSKESKKDVHAAIHSTLVNLIKRCPRRSMLVLKNVHRVPQAWLPVLDVFLQPLSGKVSSSIDGGHGSKDGGVLDTVPTVFVFLFESNEIANAPSTDQPHWKEYLDVLWRFPGVEFTPQALIGRLGQGIIVSHGATAASACAAMLTRTSFDLDMLLQLAVPVVGLAVAAFVGWLAIHRKGARGRKQRVPKDEMTFIPQSSSSHRPVDKSGAHPVAHNSNGRPNASAPSCAALPLPTDAQSNKDSTTDAASSRRIDATLPWRDEDATSLPSVDVLVESDETSADTLRRTPRRRASPAPIEASPSGAKPTKGKRKKKAAS